MKDHIFFTSPAHTHRFLEAMERIGKVYGGKLDPEYAAAFYILTAAAESWHTASRYVSRRGIDFEALLKKEYFSSGELVLVQLAGNLFNSQTHLDPVELMSLDETNFKVALTALQVRRSNLSLSAFKEG